MVDVNSESRWSGWREAYSLHRENITTLMRSQPEAGFEVAEVWELLKRDISPKASGQISILEEELVKPAHLVQCIEDFGDNGIREFASYWGESELSVSVTYRDVIERKVVQMLEGIYRSRGKIEGDEFIQLYFADNFPNLTSLKQEAIKLAMQTDVTSAIAEGRPLGNFVRHYNLRNPDTRERVYAKTIIPLYAKALHDEHGFSVTESQYKTFLHKHGIFQNGEIAKRLFADSVVPQAMRACIRARDGKGFIALRERISESWLESYFRKHIAPELLCCVKEDGSHSPQSIQVHFALTDKEVKIFCSDIMAEELRSILEEKCLTCGLDSALAYMQENFSGFESAVGQFEICAKDLITARIKAMYTAHDTEGLKRFVKKINLSEKDARHYLMEEMKNGVLFYLSEALTYLPPMEQLLTTGKVGMNITDLDDVQDRLLAAFCLLSLCSFGKEIAADADIDLAYRKVKVFKDLRSNPFAITALSRFFE